MDLQVFKETINAYGYYAEKTTIGSHVRVCSNEYPGATLALVSITSDIIAMFTVYAPIEDEVLLAISKFADSINSGK